MITEQFLGTPMLTPEEVAQRLNVTRRTVMDWIYRGVLPSVKVGKQVRVDAADLERFIQQHKRPR